MNLLTDKHNTDTELLVYAMTLVNKTVNGVPDIVSILVCLSIMRSDSPCTGTRKTEGSDPTLIDAAKGRKF